MPLVRSWTSANEKGLSRTEGTAQIPKWQATTRRSHASHQAAERFTVGRREQIQAHLFATCWENGVCRVSLSLRRLCAFCDSLVTLRVSLVFSASLAVKFAIRRGPNHRDAENAEETQRASTFGVSLPAAPVPATAVWSFGTRRAREFTA